MKLPYSEGSLFLVPLQNSSFARGIVARASKKGKILLGYFFGPRLHFLDNRIVSLNPCDSIVILRFGDLGLIKGEWPILGTMTGWHRSEWPMPEFVRRDPLGHLKSRIVEYSDSDPGHKVSERVDEGNDDLPIDSISGCGAVSLILNKILD